MIEIRLGSSAAALLLFIGCAERPAATSLPMRGDVTLRAGEPFAGLKNVDKLIEPEETHFKHLWQVTSGIENAAEGYWSFTDNRLVMQITEQSGGCDQIFVSDDRGGALLRVSNGKGVTTCSYFMPDDRSVLYASTHAEVQDCPKRPDASKGYVWSIHPEYDIYVHDLVTRSEKLLIGGPGYDAEATVSPKGDRIVFTSTRSGDLELWTSDLEGGDLRQVTDEPGYDGGAFFNNAGTWLVFRSTAFQPEKLADEQAEYAELLKDWKVRPTRMELMLVKPDGTERRQLTKLGKANWAPFFFPNDKRVLFASNHHNDKPGMPNFDLFAIDVDGTNLERITTYAEFDSFAAFSPDGRYLAFASNRGGKKQGETNMFIAEWR